MNWTANLKSSKITVDFRGKEIHVGDNVACPYGGGCYVEGIIKEIRVGPKWTRVIVRSQIRYKGIVRATRDIKVKDSNNIILLEKASV